MLLGLETPDTLTFGNAIASLHPLLVHFPIALLLAALPAEFLRTRGSTTGAPSTTRFLVIAGALSALAAGITGWIKASIDGGGYDGGDIGWHKWSGVAVTALGLALWILAPTVASGRVRLIAFRITLVLTAVVICVTGHFGAVLAGHQFDVMQFLRSLGGG